MKIFLLVCVQIGPGIHSILVCSWAAEGVEIFPFVHVQTGHGIHSIWVWALATEGWRFFHSFVTRLVLGSTQSGFYPRHQRSGSAQSRFDSRQQRDGDFFTRLYPDLSWDPFSLVLIPASRGVEIFFTRLCPDWSWKPLNLGFIPGCREVEIFPLV